MRVDGYNGCPRQGVDLWMVSHSLYGAEEGLQRMGLGAKSGVVYTQPVLAYAFAQFATLYLPNWLQTARAQHSQHDCDGQYTGSCFTFISLGPQSALVMPMALLAAAAINAVNRSLSKGYSMRNTWSLSRS